MVVLSKTRKFQEEWSGLGGRITHTTSTQETGVFIAICITSHFLNHVSLCLNCTGWEPLGAARATMVVTCHYGTLRLWGTWTNNSMWSGGTTTCIWSYTTWQAPNPDTFTFLCPSVCCFTFIVAKQLLAHVVINRKCLQFILLCQCTFYMENEALESLSLLGSGINNDDSSPPYEYTHGSNRELKLKPWSAQWDVGMFVRECFLHSTQKRIQIK